jgi:hypothetical protein
MMKSDQRASPLKVTESVHRHDEIEGGFERDEVRKEKRTRNGSLVDFDAAHPPRSCT